MLFNSLNFAIFLPIVFLIYWFVTNKNLRLQNALLLIVSYYFYASWDWRFLFLLLFSTFLDFYTGIMVSESSSKKVRKIWFWTSICVNLGFLGIFKYFDFFAASLAEGMKGLGLHLDPWTLGLILPVGISFYTFHGLSYVIDIYYKRINAEKNFVDYGVFVSFFPLLVAGPIERATHLLPQIKKARKFEYIKAVDGLRQILWGLFKKVVIADQCAVYVNQIFNNSAELSGSTLLLGAVFFTFQIYGDFSGYSDIALGTARLFGIELLTNFSFPYFSRDIAEFWRRWHISLSTWFKDYLYIPLGGSRSGKWKAVLNTFIIFIVSGFWHGANWTFIVWGLLNAIYILPSVFLKTNRNNLDIVALNSLLPSLKDTFGMLHTFFLTTIAWVFFRSMTLTQAFQIVHEIFSNSIFSIPSIFPMMPMALICIFLIIEWIGRRDLFAIQTSLHRKSRFLRWTFYFTLVGCIVFFSGKEQAFIYFQF
jgi:alginate O-acetyltransferase complex protein AlgI